MWCKGIVGTMAGIVTYMMLLCTTIGKADLVVEETTFYFQLATMH